MDSIEEREAALRELEAEIEACKKCPLYQARTRPVPGSGPVTADVMFIGEAPGFYEDQQGLPFVGASGKYLDELLRGIGLSRDEVYIANVIKCRPPGNRDPLAPELEACKPFLDRQIEIINPKVIATLGRFSMARYFKGRITKIHGQPKQIGSRIIIPLFHPAAVLRNPRLRPAMEADMRKIPELIEQAAKLSGEEEAPPTGEQLSLF